MKEPRILKAISGKIRVHRVKRKFYDVFPTKQCLSELKRSMKECPVISALKECIACIAQTTLSENPTPNKIPSKSYDSPEFSQYHFFIGFSGGLDSTVLLHGLSQLIPSEDISAIHVHHGLSKNADVWQMHCETFALALGVRLIAERVELSLLKKGVEAAARDARYRVFGQHINGFFDNLENLRLTQPILMLGHHLDDQQETLLLRLMRGAGPTGLQSIPKQRSLGKGTLIRPLLLLSRAQLHEYALSHQLSWINDESNQDVRYDRNFLRNNVIPLLQQRWPYAGQRCAQTAQLCVENESLLADLAVLDTHRVNFTKEKLGFSLCIASLAKLKKARRNNLLRYHLQQQGFALPEQVHLQQMSEQLQLDTSQPMNFQQQNQQPCPQKNSPSDNKQTHCEVRWANVQLCSYQQRLYILPFEKSHPSKPSSGDFWLWDGFQPLRLPLGNLGFAELSLELGGDWAWQGHPIRVSFRSASTPRMQPVHRGRSQTLKKLLQEYRVPTWLRAWVPLLCEESIPFFNEESLEEDSEKAIEGLQACGAVGDLWVNKGHQSDKGKGYRVVWTFFASNADAVERFSFKSNDKSN